MPIEIVIVFLSVDALSLCNCVPADNGSAVFFLDSFERDEGLAEKTLNVSSPNRSANPCCICRASRVLRLIRPEHVVKSVGVEGDGQRQQSFLSDPARLGLHLAKALKVSRYCFMNRSPSLISSAIAGS